MAELHTQPLVYYTANTSGIIVPRVCTSDQPPSVLQASAYTQLLWAGGGKGEHCELCWAGSAADDCSGRSALLKGLTDEGHCTQRLVC